MPARRPSASRAWRWGGTLALLAVALVCSLLTVWQLQRLAWKTALLARVAALPRASAEPLPSVTEAAHLSRAQDEYRRLRLQGRWMPEVTQAIRASTEQGRGHWLLTPLALGDGQVVWVNRGFVDADHRDPSRHAPPPALEGPPREGLLRWPEDSALPFLAPMLRHPQRLSAAAGLRPERTAPYFVDLTAQAGDPPWPRAGLTVLQFRNHHAVYAATWAALAAGALLGAWLWWRKHPPTRAAA